MNKNIIILILAAALFILLFLKPSCNKPVLEKPVVETKVIVKEGAIREVVSKKYQDSVSSEIKRRDAKAASLTRDLRAAEGLVNDLLADLQSQADSTCPDLSGEVAALTSEVEQKDSLCTAIIAEKDSIITGKDTLLAEKDKFAASLKSDIQAIAANESVKDRNIRQLKKEVRKRTFGGVVWKVAAGVAAGLFLNEKLK